MRVSAWKRTLIFAALLFAACGDAPLGSIGQRSSDWVNEPTVVTTTTVPTTVPLVADASSLIWFNDDLGPGPVEPEAVVAAVFARREGDRFIQASRAEIATALPGIDFPSRVPPLAEYVTSQLVIENSGIISDNPSAAFGLWTAEPYTRSRSVGQMIVIRVYRDAQTIAELQDEDADASCARFADAATGACTIEDVDGNQTWVLEGSGGTTLVFFDEAYRYEMFGRPFASLESLRQTVMSMEPLTASTGDTTEGS